MHVSFVRVVSLLLVMLLPQPSSAQSTLRIRALDDGAAAALEEGLTRSELFRQLTDEIEGSDVIVHVLVRAMPPGKAVGTTQLTSASPRCRYVRITISRDLSLSDRVAILGHELRHAIEIARSQAHDPESVRWLYQAIGQRVEPTQEAYETQAAIDTGRRVWFDLRHRTRPPMAKAQDR